MDIVATQHIAIFPEVAGWKPRIAGVLDSALTASHGYPLASLWKRGKGESCCQGFTGHAGLTPMAVLHAWL
jgi:hypothetical protein